MICCLWQPARVWRCFYHRVHRAAMSTSWSTFLYEGKILPGWRVQGEPSHPLLLYLPSCTNWKCTLQLRGQIHSPYLSSTPYTEGTLWFLLQFTVCTQSLKVLCTFPVCCTVLYHVAGAKESIARGSCCFGCRLIWLQALFPISFHW